MTTKIELVWDELRKEAQSRPIAEATYKLRRVDPSARFNVYAGLDGSAFVMLAIGVTKSPRALALDSVSLDYFRQRRNDGTWLMALRLRQQDLSGVFGRLCQDLVDAMAVVLDEEALVALFRDRLALWTKLFDNGAGGLLGPNQVKGLIAELLVLEGILKGGERRPLEAVTAWVGPKGADQDFQFADEAIEVKAISPGADSISISSLQQLEALVPIKLTLFTMRVASPGESGGIGLNNLVARMEGNLAAYPDALSVFLARLQEGGYVENPHYDMTVFQPMAREEITITETSPKLVVATVPTGVTSASYTLALAVLRISC